MKYSPIKMKELLEKYGFNLKKKFGQNFIIDENTIQNILRKAEVDQDTFVLEVGPGAGSLTFYLSMVAGHVLAYEIDRTLKPVLQEVLEEKSNVIIQFEDFLKANVKEQLLKYSEKKHYLVANLPYYITTPIIMKVIEEQLLIDKMVIMVQKEVGDRFKAEPGNKEYNSLSIFLNYYFEIRKILDISKNVFVPRPNVDSIVLELKRREQKLDVGNEEFFFQLVRDSFVQKRKTLRNNLKNYDLDQLQEILVPLGYDLSIRAEQLSIQVFAQISKQYKKAS